MVLCKDLFIFHSKLVELGEVCPLIITELKLESGSTEILRTIVKPSICFSWYVGFVLSLVDLKSGNGTVLPSVLTTQVIFKYCILATIDTVLGNPAYCPSGTMSIIIAQLSVTCFLCNLH